MLRHLIKHSFHIKYSDFYCGPISVSYTLTKDHVEKSISKRFGFHEDKHIPKNTRAKNKHYKRTGYDKGHLAPDAAFDYDRDVLYETYSLTNVCPMTRSLNRYNWTKAERFARLMARKFNTVGITNTVLYDDNNLMRLGRVAIPMGFIKTIKTAKKTWQFFYTNSKKVHNKKLSEHMISNEDVRLLMSTHNTNASK